MKLLAAFCLMVCSAFAQTNVHVSSITKLATNAKHPSWCKANCGKNVIAYQQQIPGSGNVYQVWSMDANGENQTCLSCTPYAQAHLPGATCGLLGRTQCTSGNPQWAPNGDIVFQQQRTGCSLTALQATPGTGLCNDLIECDPNFTQRCTTIATSGSGDDSGFLQFRFSSDGTKLFGGHVVETTGSCTAIFGEALAIRVFNWTDAPSATPIVYTGPSTLNGDILPASYMPGNTCDSAFVEGATTYPTSIEPVTKTLFFSMVGNTTQAFRQYSMDISSGDAATIMGTLKTVSPGGNEWSEMGNIDPSGKQYAYVSSTCTPIAPPVTIKNVALDLAVQNLGDGNKLCATQYNTPGSPMYFFQGGYVQVEDFDWASDDGVHNNQVVANVSDNLTFNDIYLFSLVFETQVGPPVLSTSNPVVNGGSFTPAFTSGEWVTIFGQNLAPEARQWGPTDFAGNMLPTELDGVSVKINGIPAYVYYISSSQINVLAPDDPTTGTVSVQVTSSGFTSQTVMVNKQPFVPAFFILPVGGDKYIAAVHGNGTVVGSTKLYPGVSTPAKAGEEIELYGTGFGPTNPPTPANQVVIAPFNNLANNVTVTIGGAPAKVDFQGMTESGVDQINVIVPAGLSSGDHLVVATVNGVQSQANAYITVQ